MIFILICLKIWDDWTESYIPVNKGRYKRKQRGRYYGRRY